MDRPTVVVVGLGPGDQRYLTQDTVDRLSHATVARLRTRQHPAAIKFEDVASYDDWYDTALDFESLYAAIVDDLVRLAHSAPDHCVVFAVPGSPLVAERTVELLRQRDDVTLLVEPAVSVIDVACAALGIDPMEVGLRIVDGLSDEPLRGPGPLLVLQTYAPEVLALLADRLPPSVDVVVLHHLSLADERTIATTSDALASQTADHLTSVWIPHLRTVGVAIEELSDLTTKLRRECVWDQEQTHESLLPHLVEEAYEALDAIAEYVANGEDADSTHVAEELGDLLFQIAFHAELGHEIGAFDLTLIADGVREKLIARHPHVFGDVVVTDAQDAANRWEQLKKIEKQRDSVTDGIATQLPALTLYPKLWRKASAVGADGTDPDEAIEIASRALTRIESGDVDRATLVDLIEVAVVFSAMRGIDLEGALRERALELRALIRRWESRSSS